MRIQSIRHPATRRSLAEAAFADALGEPPIRAKQRNLPTNYDDKPISAGRKARKPRRVRVRWEAV